MPNWLWIPLTLFAALAQTARNAAQRHLVDEVGTLGATLVRFLFGLPFAIAWLSVLSAYGLAVPPPTFAFIAWILTGSLAQIAATALLLRIMTDRNFALGVAYSKTEIVQVAVFGLLFLGDAITLSAAVAITLATAGLMVISVPGGDRAPGLLTGWTSRTALLGMACGACFAVAVVGYRGGILSLGGANPAVGASYALVWSTGMQTLLLGGWLLLRAPAVIRGVLREWRTSMAAGFLGAVASAGWFTAFALEPAAHVRTLGLAEMLFSYVASRRLFQERLRRTEVVGIALLTCGLAAITLAR